MSPVLPSSKVGYAELVLAENQPQYDPLNVVVGGSPNLLVGGTPHMLVTARMKLTPEEIQQIVDGGEIWVQQMTFGSGFFPMLIRTTEPTPEECGLGLPLIETVDNL